MEDEKAVGPALVLTLDDVSGVLKASITPDARLSRIDPFWVRDRLSEAGFSPLKVRMDGVKNLIAQYNAGKPVNALDIAERVNASVQVVLSGDGLEARLTIFPPQGGNPATKAEVLEQLALKGINEGVLVDEINRAIADKSANDLVIARGREPVAGDDGRLEYLLPEIRERVPNVDASGRTDYRDLGEIQVVHAGDALMRHYPPTAGTPGVSVTGQTIAPKPGKDVRFNTRLNGAGFAADDPDLLIATIDGQPVRVKDGMIVEPVLSLETVNMTTGNIHFDGAVLVRGDVTAGMHIQASGDIEIGGVVEPATLESGGSIVVKNGVLGGIGQKEGGAHHIRCAGCFSATYAQQARIEAGDSIFIDDLAMQCELNAGNHIRLGDKRRGQVIGGKLQATLSIHARTIGAPNRIRTELTIGTDPALTHALQTMVQQRDTKENQLLEIGKLLSFSDHNPGRVSAEVRQRAEQTAAAISSDIENMRTEEEQVRHRIDLTQCARVDAEKALYEGVSVAMGEAHLKIHGEHGPSTVRLAEQGLGIFPLEEHSTPDAER